MASPPSCSTTSSSSSSSPFVAVLGVLSSFRKRRGLVCPNRVASFVMRGGVAAPRHARNRRNRRFVERRLRLPASSSSCVGFLDDGETFGIVGEFVAFAMRPARLLRPPGSTARPRRRTLRRPGLGGRFRRQAQLPRRALPQAASASRALHDDGGDFRACADISPSARLASHSGSGRFIGLGRSPARRVGGDALRPRLLGVVGRHFAAHALVIVGRRRSEPRRWRRLRRRPFSSSSSSRWARDSSSSSACRSASGI